MSDRCYIAFSDLLHVVTVFGAASDLEFKISELEDDNDELNLIDVQSDIQVNDKEEILRWLN